jgi:hypothetical protein
MLRHSGSRGSRIVVTDCIENCLVLTNDGPDFSLIETLIRPENPNPIAPTNESPSAVGEARRSRQANMKLSVPGTEGGAVISIGIAAHLMEQPIDIAYPDLGYASSSQTLCDKCLDTFAHVEGLGELSKSHWQHNESPLRDLIDQAFAIHDSQGFPYWGPGNPEMPSYCHLRTHLTNRQASVNHHSHDGV